MRAVAGIGDPGRLNGSQVTGISDPGYNRNNLHQRHRNHSFGASRKGKRNGT